MGLNLSLLLQIDIVFSSGLHFCISLVAMPNPSPQICEAFSAQGCGIQSTLILVETEDALTGAHSLSSLCGTFFSFFPNKIQSFISNEIRTININTVVTRKSKLILEEELTSTQINEI